MEHLVDSHFILIRLVTETNEVLGSMIGSYFGTQVEMQWFYILSLFHILHYFSTKTTISGFILPHLLSELIGNNTLLWDVLPRSYWTLRWVEYLLYYYYLSSNYWHLGFGGHDCKLCLWRGEILIIEIQFDYLK